MFGWGIESNPSSLDSPAPSDSSSGCEEIEDPYKDVRQQQPSPPPPPRREVPPPMPRQPSPPARPFFTDDRRPAAPFFTGGRPQPTQPSWSQLSTPAQAAVVHQPPPPRVPAPLPPSFYMQPRRPPPAEMDVELEVVETHRVAPSRAHQQQPTAAPSSSSSAQSGQVPPSLETSHHWCPYPLPNPFTDRASNARSGDTSRHPELDTTDSMIVDLAFKLIAGCKQVNATFSKDVEYTRLFTQVVLDTNFMSPWSYMEATEAASDKQGMHRAIVALLGYDADISGPDGVFPETASLPSTFNIPNPILLMSQKIPSAAIAYKKVLSDAEARGERPSVRDAVEMSIRLFNSRCGSIITQSLSEVHDAVHAYVQSFLPLIFLEMRAEVSQEVTNFLLQYAAANKALMQSSRGSGGGGFSRPGRDNKNVSSFWTTNVVAQAHSRHTVIVRGNIWVLGAKQSAETNHPLLKYNGGGKSRISKGDVLVLEVGDQSHGFKNSKCALGVVQQVDMMGITVEVRAGPQMLTSTTKETTTVPDLLAIFGTVQTPTSSTLKRGGVTVTGTGQGMVVHVVGSVSGYSTMQQATTELFNGGIGHGSLLCGTSSTKTSVEVGMPGVRRMANFNWAQSAAIQIASSDVKPIPKDVQPRYRTVVVEGPPGTGKTHTIVGIVSSILHEVGKGGRVLMCAPSNAAVDEVALRLSRMGLISRSDLGLGDIKEEPPKLDILRVGVRDSVDENIKTAGHYLDDRVELALEIEHNCPEKLRAYARAKRKLTDAEFDDLSRWRSSIPQRLRRAASKGIIEKANVICATLGSVHQVSSALESNGEAPDAFLMQFLASCADILDATTVGPVKTDKPLRYVEGSYLRKMVLSPAIEMNFAISIAERILCRKGFLEYPDHDMEAGVREGSIPRYPMPENEPPAFSAIIVDEASQATEPQTLMPLITSRGCRRLVLVGDPAQLRPTILSRSAERLGFANSLILRLSRLRLLHPTSSQTTTPTPQRSDLPAVGGLSLFRTDTQSEVQLEQLPQYGQRIRWVRLVQQYRMHPSIVRFPNDAFYQGTLRNGRFENYHLQPQSTATDFSFCDMLATRVQFFDVTEGMMWKGGGGGGGQSSASDFTSMSNPKEAIELVSAVRNLVHTLSTYVIPRLRSSGCTGSGSMMDFLTRVQDPTDLYREIGIITFYKSQEREIRNLLGGYRDKTDVDYFKGNQDERLIQVSSVDGFQGKEKTFIFLSCVRARERGRSFGAASSLGFLRDPHRMNVALTRAKEYCYIFGHAQTLSSGEYIGGSNNNNNKRGREGEGVGGLFVGGADVPVARGDHWAELVALCLKGGNNVLKEVPLDGSTTAANAPEELARNANSTSVSIGFTTLPQPRGGHQQDGGPPPNRHASVRQ